MVWDPGLLPWFRACRRPQGLSCGDTVLTGRRGPSSGGACRTGKGAPLWWPPPCSLLGAPGGGLARPTTTLPAPLPSPGPHRLPRPPPPPPNAPFSASPSPRRLRVLHDSTRGPQAGTGPLPASSQPTPPPRAPPHSLPSLRRPTHRATEVWTRTQQRGPPPRQHPPPCETALVLPEPSPTHPPHTQGDGEARDGTGLAWAWPRLYGLALGTNVLSPQSSREGGEPSENGAQAGTSPPPGSGPPPARTRPVFSLRLSPDAHPSSSVGRAGTGQGEGRAGQGQGRGRAGTGQGEAICLPMQDAPGPAGPQERGWPGCPLLPMPLGTQERVPRRQPPESAPPPPSGPLRWAGGRAPPADRTGALPCSPADLLPDSQRTWPPSSARHPQ